ncbi:ribonuclease III [Porphyromonas crevioricanis JCM 15906]|uniref:Ribonuclease 3 n=1 Tax=Porphyromonas crevioricanis JCM 15906 TaxID=1305617 RepID=T1CT37_9PORP|nr:ribonuclease III [Porphyromonas crevioricanis JCM 15906]
MGFDPANWDLYSLAFRHSSCSLTALDGTQINNERLEFLGDSVLATAISHFLYCKYPQWQEGELSQRRGMLVKRAVNNKIAQEMGLGQMINAKMSINKMSQDTLGNALEALIGAIFLDKGYQQAETFVHEKFLHAFYELEGELEDETTNYKSQLLEWVQKHHLSLEYKMLREPGRSRGEFVCAVVVNGLRVGVGYGHNKKEAHQDASHNALKELTKAQQTIEQ